jgi:hypothetical protein
MKNYPPMKMEQTECSETSAYKIQTPGNYPEGKHATFTTRREFEIKNSPKPVIRPHNIPLKHHVGQRCSVPVFISYDKFKTV